MYALRLTIFLAVLSALTMSLPISAQPVETSPAPPKEPAASNEAARESQDPQAAQSESDAVAASDTVADSTAAPKSDTATDAETETEPDAETESDAVTESEVTTQTAPSEESSAGEEPDRVIKAAPAEKPEDTEAGFRNSVNLSFLVSSIYNFRGLNVFKETSQADQRALFSPSVTGTVFHPGVWIKYAGFFQINGDNRGYLIDSGVGAEQDIAVGFDYDFTDKLSLSTSLTYYFFPFALSRITGVDWPSYLEPAVGIQYKTDHGTRLGLQLSYFAPIQDRLRDQRYMYTNLIVGRSFQFTARLALDFDFSFGYKLFADPSILQDTIFDLDFCVSLPVSLADRLKLVPGMHAAWAYFVNTRFGDQYMVYLSLDLVADF